MIIKTNLIFDFEFSLTKSLPIKFYENQSKKFFKQSQVTLRLGLPGPNCHNSGQFFQVF